MTHSLVLGPHIPTRSPFCKPMAKSPAARSFTWIQTIIILWLCLKMTNTNILADGQVVSDKIKCINIGKQRHYSREIIHHLRVTLCLTYILFKLWHCRLAHESAIIFTMDTYIAHIAALKKSHSNSLPKLNNLSIPLAESFQLPMLQEGVCLRELWLLCLHNTQYAGFLCFGSDTLCDYWINWVWEKKLSWINLHHLWPDATLTSSWKSANVALWLSSQNT